MKLIYKCLNHKGGCTMQRNTTFYICFLLFALLTFIAGCTKAPVMMEQPKPVQQPAQTQTKPIEQPAQVSPTPAEKPTQPQLPVKRGSLVIISEPIGADVKVDDNPMGTTPLVLKDVPAGSYRIEVGLTHYETYQGEVDVKHQQMTEVREKLKPKPSALEVKSQPTGATIWMDGKKVGVTPYKATVTADGEHEIILSAKEYGFKSQKVTVPPEGKQSVSITLEKQEGKPVSIIREKDGAVMMLIPAGEFQMGSPEGGGNDNERPQHIVFLDAFYIDKYEVTNAQYKMFMDATGHKAPYYWDDPKYNAPNQPVVGVTWDDANAYAEWVGARLPTEAEWEKSARGGLVGKKYPWGDDITHNDANYSGTGGKDQWEQTSPVGSFAPNGYGLYDMAGNVLEWCADWYDQNYYATSPKSNPTGPSSGSSRVVRGGSWYLYADVYFLRVASRSFHGPALIIYSVGFRCVQ